MATAEVLMTAEEFGRRPDPGQPEELVQGKVVAMPPPDRRHGFICTEADRIPGDFVAGSWPDRGKYNLVKGQFVDQGFEPGGVDSVT